MLNKDNEYMLGLYAMGAEYQKKRDELKAEKKEIAEKYGYGSAEMQEWYEKDKALQWPFKPGECKAFTAWQDSIDQGLADLVMNDFLWDNEVEDFLSTLHAAGIESFVYTNSSTASMDNIHAFVENRCYLFGPSTITKKVMRFGSEAEEKVFGIRFVTM